MKDLLSNVGSGGGAPAPAAAGGAAAGGAAAEAPKEEEKVEEKEESDDDMVYLLFFSLVFCLTDMLFQGLRSLRLKCHLYVHIIILHPSPRCTCYIVFLPQKNLYT